MNNTTSATSGTPPSGATSSNVAGNATASAPQKKGGSKTMLWVGIIVVVIIIIAAAVLLMSSPGFGFPSAQQVSSAMGTSFSAKPIIHISSSNASLALYSSYGVVGAEIENYTSSTGTLGIMELQFKSSSEVSTLFSTLSSFAGVANVTTTSFKGGQFMVTPTGTAFGAFKNYLFVIEFVSPSGTSTANATAITSLAKDTISAI
ncbi:MAG: hypothetical protein ACP5TL_00440 [Candidatus Micrarchaeia archaeon]